MDQLKNMILYKNVQVLRKFLICPRDFECDQLSHYERPTFPHSTICSHLKKKT